VKNILLTGVTGFIGSGVLKKLSKHDKIYCIKRGKNRSIKNKDQIKDLYYKNYDDLNDKLKKIKIDTVIHCATHYVKKHSYEDIKKLAESNIIFGNIILENIDTLKVKKFINLTTVWENYNNQRDDCFNLYSAYKKSFTNILNFYKKNNPSVKFYNIFLSDSFGKEDKRKKIINILKKNYKKNVITKIISSKLYLNLLNIEDIVAGISILVNKNIKTGNYNMVNLHYYSILKIVRNFNKIYTKKLKVKWISQKFLKEKILKNNTIKGWSPIKSNINDLLRVIKD